MKTRKVKVIKYLKDSGGSEYYETFSQGVTVWDEISQEEYIELDNAIFQANSNRKDKWHYMVIEQVEDNQEVFQSAKEFIEYEKHQDEKRRKEQQERDEKKQASKLERKRRQLEKLQNELNVGVVR